MISVLGAGPAGSTAAYYLAKNGIDVELIDKQKFPRDKPCAGGLANPILFYKEFPFTKNLNGVYIYKVRIYAGKYEFEYKSKIPLLETFLRRDLDNKLFQNAVKTGAKFKLNQKPGPGIIINAAGINTAKPYKKVGLCLVNDFRIKSGIDTAHIHYCFKGIRGYAWCFPKKAYANIGIGALLPQKNIKQLYEDYIDFLESKRIITVDSKPYSAKLIPLSHIKKPYTKNTILVGDAAGFVRPSTGEGIYFAMCSGKIAANTIIKKKPFKWYAQECSRKFGRWMKPVPLTWSGFLLSKAMQHCVKKAEKNKEYRERFARNFFRI